MNMLAANSNKTLIIETYKTFSSLILEVSRKELITGAWISEQADTTLGQEPFRGHHLSEIHHQNILGSCIEAVRTVFNGGTVQSFEGLFRCQTAS